MRVQVPPLLPKPCGDGVTGNTSVSKTDVLGSNPSSRAFLFLRFYIVLYANGLGGYSFKVLIAGSNPVSTIAILFDL